MGKIVQGSLPFKREPKSSWFLKVNAVPHEKLAFFQIPLPLSAS